ncbi:MAG: A/G-specific adenine glycosylase [Bacteroidales bacterium]
MKISNIITNWYKKNKRSLPWREENDPYRIWLSEVILQQTRVSQGLSYYNRFVVQYPDIYVLAAADEQEVMKLWQGLGYYSRARNLLAAARQVVNDFGGVFPGDRDSLLKLKGVGEYTAAAVASIAFNEPVAVVDGNVARVLSRLFAIDEPVNTSAGERIIMELAGELLDRTQPGEYNQAIMEFGALQCIPARGLSSRSATSSSKASSTASSTAPFAPSPAFHSSPAPLSASPSPAPPIPNCPACPLNTQCLAFSNNSVDQYPVKLKKTAVKRRYFTYLVISHSGYTYIQQRTGNDIWKQLFEFPLIEDDDLVRYEDMEEKIGKFVGPGDRGFEITFVSEPVVHQLTHRTITARFVHLRIVRDGYVPRKNWKKVRFGEIGDHPLPRLIDRYLELPPDQKG